MFSGGPLNRIITGELRKQLKERIDELLKANEATQQKIEQLSKSIDNLAAIIQQQPAQRLDPETSKQITDISADWKVSTAKLFDTSKLVVDALRELVAEINKNL
jgi:polyhydroxyalkanoate synthesis regulator phasin